MTLPKPDISVRFLILLFLTICSLENIAQVQKKTYCNPMDISYRYNFEQLNEKISYRSGADPVIINHKKEYYLFVTIQGGWWHSKDLSQLELYRARQVADGGYVRPGGSVGSRYDVSVPVYL